MFNSVGKIKMGTATSDEGGGLLSQIFMGKINHFGILIVIFSFLTLSCLKSSKKTEGVQVENFELITVEDNEEYEKKLILAANQYIKDNKEEGLIIDYWRLLEDSIYTHEWIPTSNQHRQDNFLVVVDEIQITPYTRNSDSLSYKLFNDTLGHLLNYSLLLEVDKFANVKNVKARYITGRINPQTNMEEVYRHFVESDKSKGLLYYFHIWERPFFDDEVVW